MFFFPRQTPVFLLGIVILSLWISPFLFQLLFPEKKPEISPEDLRDEETRKVAFLKNLIANLNEGKRNSSEQKDKKTIQDCIARLEKQLAALIKTKIPS